MKTIISIELEEVKVNGQTAITIKRNIATDPVMAGNEAVLTGAMAKAVSIYMDQIEKANEILKNKGELLPVDDFGTDFAT